MSEGTKPVMFQNPPVTEAALGVLFKPLAALRALHFGVFWQQFRAEYPIAEVQPPLPHQAEKFSSGLGNLLQHAPLMFPFALGDDVSRNAFLSEDRSRVIQLQRDRLIINWRKNSSSPQYPGYTQDMRATFSERWQKFSAFLSDNKIGQPEIEQCEVIYVNTILQGEGWSSLSDLASVIAPWSGKLNDESALPLEGLNLNATMVVPNSRGRVYINLSPAAIANGSQINLQLVITTRVVPVPGDSVDMFEMMDLAHHWGVRSFAAFTSKQMHERWGRT